MIARLHGIWTKAFKFEFVGPFFFLKSDDQPVILNMEKTMVFKMFSELRFAAGVRIFLEIAFMCTLYNTTWYMLLYIPYYKDLGLC